MRNTTTIGLLLGALTVAACGGEEPQVKAPETTAASVNTTPAPVAPPPVEAPPPPKPTLAELQMKAGQGMIEGWNSHDAKKIAEFYANDALVSGPAFPEQKGKESVTANLAGMFAGIPDIKVAPRFVFMKNEVVVAVIDMVGTHKGDLMGMPASGKPVGFTVAVAQWFNNDGLVKEEHVYVDDGTIAGQVGMSKQKVRSAPTLGAMTAFAAKNNDAETKNADLIKTWYGAFEKKSADTFLGSLADGTEWDDMTMPDTFKGKDHAKKYFAEATKAFPDSKVTIKNAWGIDEFVVAEVTFAGTQKGPFMGMKASNKPVSMDTLDIMRVKDGKVVKGWSFGNSMQVAAQLGLLPKPGAPAAKPAGKPAAPAGKPATPAPKKK
ncbi:MAG: ester cyclase [Polyangiaceae bacterium]